MAITYINGVSLESLDDLTYLGQNSATRLGNYDTGVPTAWLNTDREVIGDNLSEGSLNPQSKRLFNNDRSPNQPSGYSANGMATYGDGKQNINTTFNPDYSYAGNNSRFEYSAPLRPSGVNFGSLT